MVKNGTSRPGKNITPSIVPIISNGAITNVNIQDGGDEFYSTPDLVVVGDGTSARLRAVVDRDENSSTFLKIIDVTFLKVLRLVYSGIWIICEHIWFNLMSSIAST